MLLTVIEQHSHHTGVSLTIRRRDTPTMAVHSHGDCRVAHKLALHRDWSTRFIQPRAIAVTKRMPSDGAESRMFRRRAKHVVLGRVSVVGFLAKQERAGENEIAVGGERRLRLPAFKGPLEPFRPCHS